MATRFDDWEGDFLEHHGIRNQKWGERRFQNEDGSLTQAGRERYGVGDGSHASTTKSTTSSDKKPPVSKEPEKNAKKEEKKKSGAVKLVKKIIAAKIAYNKAKKSENMTKGQKAVKALFLYGIYKRLLGAK